MRRVRWYSSFRQQTKVVPLSDKIREELPLFATERFKALRKILTDSKYIVMADRYTYRLIVTLASYSRNIKEIRHIPEDSMISYN